jgi:hypothetical protein
MFQIVRFNVRELLLSQLSARHALRIRKEFHRHQGFDDASRRKVRHVIATNVDARFVATQMNDARDEVRHVRARHAKDLIGVSFDIEHARLGSVDGHATFQLVNTSAVVNADDHLASILSHPFDEKPVSFVKQIETAHCEHFVGTPVDFQVRQRERGGHCTCDIVGTSVHRLDGNVSILDSFVVMLNIDVDGRRASFVGRCSTIGQHFPQRTAVESNGNEQAEHSEHSGCSRKENTSEVSRELDLLNERDKRSTRLTPVREGLVMFQRETQTGHAQRFDRLIESIVGRVR